MASSLATLILSNYLPSFKSSPMDFESKNEIHPNLQKKNSEYHHMNSRDLWICTPNSWIITHRIHGIFSIGDFCGKM